MRFDAGAGFTPTPEDDPLPALDSVPARIAADLAFHLNGLKAARAAVRAGMAVLARGTAVTPDETAGLAARSRRVDDWKRVALELALAARLYEPAVHSPDDGLARAARFVALRAAAGRLRTARNAHANGGRTPLLRRSRS